jgi:hypothetical protein
MTAYGELAVPEHVERAIVTPHDHEGPNNRPLWIVWKHEIGGDGISDGPQLDSICDSERSIRYHVAMMLERQEVYIRSRDRGEFRFHVERVPANHNFGRSDLRAYEKFAANAANRAVMKTFGQEHEP